MNILDRIPLPARFGCLYPVVILVVGLLFYGWIGPALSSFTLIPGRLANGDKDVDVIGYNEDGSLLLTRGKKKYNSSAGWIYQIHDATGRKKQTLKDLKKCYNVHISANGKEIIGTDKTSVQVFDWEGKLQRYQKPKPKDATGEVKVYDVAGVSFLKGFATADNSGIRVWYNKSDTQVTHLMKTPIGMGKILTSESGEQLAAYDAKEKRILFWPLRDLNKAIVVRNQANEIDLSADGTRLASRGENGVRVRKTSDGSVLFTLEAPKMESESFTAIDLSRDGKSIAVGQRNGHVKVWDIATGKATNEFDHSMGRMPRGRRVRVDPKSRATTATVNSLALSPDGLNLAVGIDEYVHVELGGTRYYRTQGSQRNRPTTSQVRTSTPTSSRKAGFGIIRKLDSAE